MKLNPEINLDDIPLLSPLPYKWNAINGRRIAGVKLFGIYGTNAHINIRG